MQDVPTAPNTHINHQRNMVAEMSPHSERPDFRRVLPCFQVTTASLVLAPSGKIDTRAEMTCLERACSRQVVFVAFVLFAKKCVCYGRRVQWTLPVCSDGRYVDLPIPMVTVTPSTSVKTKPLCSLTGSVLLMLRSCRNLS